MSSTTISKPCRGSISRSGPGARYFASLRLLERVKEIDPDAFTKSGLMVGLGESREEIMQVMDDLRAANVDFLTIGQYLQPTRKHAELERFWTPEEFAGLEASGARQGIPDGVGVAADALLLSCRQRFRGAAGGARLAAVTEHSETRIVPYTADLMYAVVADVERYPEFLPWVVALRVKSRAREAERDILMAEMAVGYGALRERYTSKVTLDPALRASMWRRWKVRSTGSKIIGVSRRKAMVPGWISAWLSNSPTVCCSWLPARPSQTCCSSWPMPSRRERARFRDSAA